MLDEREYDLSEIRKYFEIVNRNEKKRQKKKEKKEEGKKPKEENEETRTNE